LLPNRETALSWELRGSNNRRYFYEVQRDGTHLKKRYWGSGLIALERHREILRERQLVAQQRAELRELSLLAGRTPSEVVEKMVRTYRTFQRDFPECPVSVSDRISLLEAGLPWPSLKLIISIAKNPKFSNVDQLKTEVEQVGQVSFLRNELERLFISLSRPLKILSTVAKAFEPCRFAEL